MPDYSNILKVGHLPGTGFVTISHKTRKMPELPDLQVFSINLTRHLKNKTIEKVAVVNGKRLNVSASNLNKALNGNTIENVTREGKSLHLNTKEGNVLQLHLMLHGGLVLNNENEKAKYSIIQIVFDDGHTLSLTDYQGMATPALNPDTSDVPDALDRKAGFSYLKCVFAGNKTTVKNLLIDQHLIRGIGNAYADEILWDAKISPFSIAGKIPHEKLKDLAKSIRKVLHNAVKKISKSHPDIISGEIRDFLMIHNPHKDNAPDGSEIEKRMTAGRKTYFTKAQQLYS